MRKGLVWSGILVSLCVVSLAVIQFTPYGSKFKNFPMVNKIMSLGKKSSGIFHPQVKTLSNGLQVIVVENHRAPLVSHNIWYRVGSADEEGGKTGIAHFLEHLMFGPTLTKPRGEYFRDIESVGGTMNAFTSLDYTGYYANVAKDHLQFVMQLEADRLKNIQFEQGFFDSEKKVILEEWNFRIGDNPGQKFDSQFLPTLFKTHPYGREIIGLKADIAALTIDDVKAFHQKWYAPNNAVLVVAGDVVAEEVFTMAQNVFGMIEAKEVPKRARTLPDPLLANYTVSYEDPLQTQSRVEVAYLVPSEPQNLKASLCLAILQEIMNEKSFLFYDAMVKQEKWLLDFSVGYDVGREDSTIFGFGMTLVDGKKPEDIARVFKEKLAMLVKEGVSKSNFQDAKKRLIASVDYARDGLMYPAYMFGHSFCIGQTVDAVEDWPAELDRITLSDVNEALVTYFGPNMHYSVGYILPQTGQATQ